MLVFDLDSDPAPKILREILPVRQPLSTGGTLVDEALGLWFRWQSEAGGLPDWSVFKPFEHPQLLTHVSVSKRVAGQYLCVLVGEAPKQWLPPKIQGKFIHEAIPTQNAHDVIMRFDRALEDGLPNYVEKTMAWRRGYEYVRYRALHLPFACARDGCSRLLTVFDFETTKE